MSASRSQVLSLYRRILRAALCTPSINHRAVAVSMAMEEFRKHRDAPKDEIPFLIMLGETQLETLEVQSQNFSHVRDTGTFNHPIGSPAFAATESAEVSSASPSTRPRIPKESLYLLNRDPSNRPASRRSTPTATIDDNGQIVFAEETRARKFREKRARRQNVDAKSSSTSPQ